MHINNGRIRSTGNIIKPEVDLIGVSSKTKCYIYLRIVPIICHVNIKK